MSAKNSKKYFNFLLKKFIFIIIIVFSPILFAGCAGALAIGAIVLGAVVADGAIKSKTTVLSNPPVIRTYKPPEPPIVAKESINKIVNAPSPINTSPSNKLPELQIISPQIPKPIVRKEPDYPSMKNDAMCAYENLNWEKSTAILQQIFQKENVPKPIKWESSVLLGAIYYQNGDIASAEYYFKQAKNLDSKSLPSAQMFPPEMINFYKSVKR